MTKEGVLFGVAVFFILILVSKGTPRDTTDDPNGSRSGMSLHIDHMTGCHYLSKPFGGITPRLDSNGKHICGERDD